MLRALVPLKDLVAAKTRLAGVLAPSERRALMQAMAEDVLAVLTGHPAVASVTLLSDDPGAAMLAAAHGAHHQEERALEAKGLNAALAAACDRALPEPVSRVLVLHADLPCLAATDIDAALATLESGGMVIGTDRAGSGTNLLLFDARRTPRFEFGVDSCARHLAWAGQAGIPAQVLQRSGVAEDVDEPADLASLLVEGAPAGRATRAWLASPRLAPRLRLALGELAAQRDQQQEQSR